MDYVEAFLVEKKLSSSELTVKQYSSVLRAFQAYFRKPLDKVTRPDIIGYLNYLLFDRRIEKSTVATVESVLKSFYSFMEANNYIKESPMRGISPIKTDKKAPVYLTMMETERVRAVANGVDKLVFDTLYDTGVRVSELVGIRKRDIDFEKGTIKVFGKGAKERVVLVTSSTLQGLRVACEKLDDDARVFNCSSRTIQRRVKRMAEDAGVAKHITPHKIRHSFATHLIQNGGNVVGVQKLLGHTSLNTTQRYTHYSVDELRDMYEKAHQGGV